MTRIWRDGIRAAAIPLDGIDGVFGYANGLYAWSAAEFETCTAAGLQVARIDIDGTAWELASVLDVETGDAGPAQAAPWIRSRNAFRGDAVVYAGLDTCPALFAATSQLREDYLLWVADWTGVPHLPSMSVPSNVRLLGVQYMSSEFYDESIITDDGWHPARVS